MVKQFRPYVLDSVAINAAINNGVVAPLTGNGRTMPTSTTFDMAAREASADECPVVERYDACGAPIKPVRVNGDMVYFFGCWNGRAGHYLFDPHGASYRHNELIPWANIDGSLCHGADEKGDADIHRQVEGEAKLHHFDGWTALAWWDRSVDVRYGSNAALFAKGTHTFDDMIHIMRNWFPSIMARFKYVVRP